MRKHLAILTAALCFASVTAGSASAQNRPLTCADFVRNPDGSWSPVAPVLIKGVTMGPGVAFRPGVSFGGVDLASILERQCPH
jgi:hypothetical protein